jgi:hypothetical protein
MIWVKPNCRYKMAASVLLIFSSSPTTSCANKELVTRKKKRVNPAILKQAV